MITSKNISYVKGKKAAFAALCAGLVAAASMPTAAFASTGAPVCKTDEQIKKAQVQAIDQNASTGSFWSSKNLSLSDDWASFESICDVDDGLKVDADYAFAKVNRVKVKTEPGFGSLRMYSYKYTYRISAAKEAKYQSAAKKAIGTLKFTKSTTAPVKALRIYKYVVKNVKNIPSSTNSSLTGYSALIHHQAASYGKAQAFYTMCRDAGIPCRIIIGGDNGTYRAWNLVKAGNLWYVCDTAKASSTKDVSHFLAAEKSTGVYPDDVFTTSTFKKEFPQSTKAYPTVKDTTTKKKTSSKVKTAAGKKTNTANKGAAGTLKRGNAR